MLSSLKQFIKISNYRNYFLLLLVASIYSYNVKAQCTSTSIQTFWTATVDPTCGMKNGSLTIAVGGSFTGPFTLTLMYKANGSLPNSALQPYEGGRIINATRTSGWQTFTFENLNNNYYCVLVSTPNNGCANLDFDLQHCFPPCPPGVQSPLISNEFIKIVTPTCELKNGSMTIGIGGQFTGLYQVTLMYKEKYSDPLQRYTSIPIFKYIRLNASDPVYPLTFNNLEANYYCILIQTDQGCANRDLDMHCAPNPTVCTYTQGAWGSEGGKMKDGNGQQYSTTGLLQKVLEGGGFSVGANGRFVSITTPQQVLDFLPNGGPSFAFTHSGTIALNNVLDQYGVKKGGALLAQTITLGLNLRIPEKIAGSDILGHIPLSSISGIDAAIISYLSDKTVRGLYNLANSALGGSSLPSNISLSSIADAVDKVNNYFDECKVYQTSTAEDQNLPTTTSTTSRITTTVANQSQALQVAASPNPFRNNVRFSLESKNSGPGVLEVYDMSGIKISSLFLGNVSAGKGKIVDYKIPSLLNNGLLYVFRVNGQQVAGKLVGAK